MGKAVETDQARDALVLEPRSCPGRISQDLSRQGLPGEEGPGTLMGTVETL